VRGIVALDIESRVSLGVTQPLRVLQTCLEGQSLASMRVRM
jgi:hypothetical protein